jgi:hypothetical protein
MDITPNIELALTTLLPVIRTRIGAVSPGDIAAMRTALGLPALDDATLQAQADDAALETAHHRRTERRVSAITNTLEHWGIISRKATPGVAATIAAQPVPTVESIAGALYLSGSKGGKAAATTVATSILAALERNA